MGCSLSSCAADFACRHSKEMLCDGVRWRLAVAHRLAATEKNEPLDATAPLCSESCGEDTRQRRSEQNEREREERKLALLNFAKEER